MRKHHSTWLLVLLWAGNFAAGCQPFQSRIVEAPLPVTEQRAEILRIAPPGTPRAEALRRLAEAGVEGSEGASPTIWYCDLWDRPDQVRWHLNVALLFNADGLVYDARPAAPEVGVAAADGEPAAAGSGGRNRVARGESSSTERSPWVPEENGRF